MVLRECCPNFFLYFNIKMVLGECRPKYFNILIYFNIKMVLEECRPKYFDIQMVRGESCSIYLVERSSSSNSTIYSIVPPPPPHKKNRSILHSLMEENPAPVDMD